jgi:hypothetical protein
LTTKRLWALALAGLLCVAFFAAWVAYPSDRTPEGAYYRVAIAVNRDEPEQVFPYIETEAQHAAFTIGNYSRQARQRIAEAYPEPLRAQELQRVEELASVEAGPGVFALYAKRRGWIERLRLDLSGVESVEVTGDRATVQTARGTRYPFRRRDNGMWGLTLFTAQLIADREKAARDLARIEAAASDHERSSGKR